MNTYKVFYDRIYKCNVWPHNSKDIKAKTDQEAIKIAKKFIVKSNIRLKKERMTYRLTDICRVKKGYLTTIIGCRHLRKEEIFRSWSGSDSGIFISHYSYYNVVYQCKTCGHKWQQEERLRDIFAPDDCV